MAEPKSERRVWRVKHKTRVATHLEHTYGESGIKVVDGIATCFTRQAASALVQMRGYAWLREKDDPRTEAFKQIQEKTEAKRKSLGQRIKDGAQKVVEKVTKKKTAKGKSKPKE